MDELPPHVLTNAKQIYAGLTVEDGQAYRPSNLTEGLLFMGRWCEKCTKDDHDTCAILKAALCGNQPKEWHYHGNSPVCTAFEPRE